MGLPAEGPEVLVVDEAGGSRRPRDKELALERMRSHGADIVSREMEAFEWMGRTHRHLPRCPGSSPLTTAQARDGLPALCKHAGARGAGSAGVAQGLQRRIEPFCPLPCAPEANRGALSQPCGRARIGRPAAEGRPRAAGARQLPGDCPPASTTREGSSMAEAAAPQHNASLVRKGRFAGGQAAKRLATGACRSPRRLPAARPSRSRSRKRAAPRARNHGKIHRFDGRHVSRILHLASPRGDRNGRLFRFQVAFTISAWRCAAHTCGLDVSRPDQG